MNLIHLFNSIEKVNEDADYQFSGVRIPSFGNHRIAKDKSNNPILLLSIPHTSSNEAVANLQLQNILVLFNVNCKIKQGDKIINKIFTTISFTGIDYSLKILFLSLCEALIKDLKDTPNYNKVRNEILRFIELFRLACSPPKKTVQGLWAELFLIAASKTPSKLLSCWHITPNDKFDFNDGEERIEVKSTSGDSRIHYFSIDQLKSFSNSTTIIASLFVKQARSGKSIEDLQNEISKKLSRNHELKESLRFQIALTLGNSIISAKRLSFDWHVAKDTLKFYSIEDIPQILPINVPPLVTDVSFKSDISAIQPINIKSFKKKGPYSIACR